MYFTFLRASDVAETKYQLMLSKIKELLVAAVLQLFILEIG